MPSAPALRTTSASARTGWQAATLNSCASRRKRSRSTAAASRRRPKRGRLSGCGQPETLTFSALDSALVGPLFATEAMRACFADEARVGAMLAAEAALARAESRLGLVPEGLAGAIETVQPASLDIAALGLQTAISGVPSIPFVKAVQARLLTE